jgi:hypothetical protein
VLVAFFGADTVARKIQPAEVSAFVQKRKAQGKAGATVNAELGHLRYLFNDIKMVQRYAHLAPSHLKTAAIIAASAIFVDNMPPEIPHFTEKVA